jgi:hypothetical protein
MAKAKEERVYTTKELAEALGCNGKQVRRKLRAMDKYNDGVYTRYAWTEKQFKELVKKLQEKKQVKETKEVETK